MREREAGKACLSAATSATSPEGWERPRKGEGGRTQGGPGQELEVRVQGRREGREEPALANLPSAPNPSLQSVQPLQNDLSRDEIAFARDGLTASTIRSKCPGGVPWAPQMIEE